MPDIQELEDLELDEVALLTDEAEPAVEEAEIQILKENEEDEIEEDEEDEFEETEIEKSALSKVKAAIGELKSALESEKDKKRQTRLKMIIANLQSLLSLSPKKAAKVKDDGEEECEEEEEEDVEEEDKKKVKKAGKRISSAVHSDLTKVADLLKQAMEVLGKLSKEPGKGYSDYYQTAKAVAKLQTNTGFFTLTKDLADNFSVLTDDELVKAEELLTTLNTFKKGEEKNA